MRKEILLLLTILITLVFITPILAQDSSSLFEQYPSLKFRDFFYQSTNKNFYRFPTNVLFFDPLDLSYFPHETWDQSDWSLLARWASTYTYNQLILVDDPVETIVAHGTDIGKEYGYLDDFYLYATLFVLDNSPDGTGSCYVYYSNSLLKGFTDSRGVLIDPQFGVYLVDNHYESVYRLTNASHDLMLVKTFDPSEYPISAAAVESSSYGANDFIYEIMDKHFLADWNSVESTFRMQSSSIKVYRLEIIRSGTLIRIYINGVPVLSMDDGITTTDKNGNTVPDMVSWSYGPILYHGGLTVTCAVGDLYIYGPAASTEAE